MSSHGLRSYWIVQVGLLTDQTDVRRQARGVDAKARPSSDARYADGRLRGHEVGGGASASANGNNTRPPGPDVRNRCSVQLRAQGAPA